LNDQAHIGIDCGASGGIAWAIAGSPVWSEAMPPTEGDICDSICEVNEYCSAEGLRLVAWVEEVPRYCGRALPASSIAVLFRNFGFCLGVLQTLKIQTRLIKPQAWQKGLRLGTSKGMSRTEWKNKLKGEAQRRFPELKVTLKTSDALLLLAYGWEQQPERKPK
jgi:hypothetical protein